MNRFLGRHRVRTSFYHMVAALFLFSTVFWYFEIISDKTSFIIGMILFTVDYIAEMYDPNPDNPGDWFQIHFHRFLDGDDGEDC